LVGGRRALLKAIGDRVNDICSAGTSDYADARFHNLLSIIVDVVAIVIRDAAAICA
jgi:hypothetical protein